MNWLSAYEANVKAYCLLLPVKVNYYMSIIESTGVFFFMVLVIHIWGQAAVCSCSSASSRGVWNNIMIKINHFPLQIQSHCIAHCTRTHSVIQCCRVNVYARTDLYCALGCASYIWWCPLQYPVPVNYTLHLALVVQTVCSVKLCKLSMSLHQCRQDKSLCIYCTQWFKGLRILLDVNNTSSEWFPVQLLLSFCFNLH